MTNSKRFVGAELNDKMPHGPDLETMKAYADNAGTYSQEWLLQPEPHDMYQLLQRYFVESGETADIGCGNGRDANWLSGRGFKVTGFDASLEMIQTASKQFPNLVFKQASLPTLSDIKTTFDNILCETVIMHLPKNLIPEAIRNLLRILSHGGVLYLSWRVTEIDDIRHIDGRLYSAFDSGFVVDQFPSFGVIHFEDKISASSGKRVARLIYQKKDEV
jgi:SAM-dependent methyltransferase